MDNKKLHKKGKETTDEWLGVFVILAFIIGVIVGGLIIWAFLKITGCN